MKKSINKNLNSIAPPPPPPIIYNYIIEETLIKTRLLTRFFLNKTRKLALFSALYDKKTAPLNREKDSSCWLFSHVFRSRAPSRARVAKVGDFGKRAEQAKSWILPKGRLSILLLALALSLTHCKNDDNGGGNGGGDPDPSPEPIAPAIYLWVTGCAVLGDMTGDGMDGTCDNTDTGVDGADDICESRYAEDVPSEHRTTIMEEHETGTLGHKALLAASGGDSNLPQNFDINGKDSLPIRRPDGTQIAASWTALFNGAQDLDDSISGTEDLYWTGLNWSSADSIFKLAVPGGLAATNTCNDWGTNIATPDGGSTLNYGSGGRGSEIGDDRFIANRYFCDSTIAISHSVSVHLLCITH